MKKRRTLVGVAALAVFISTAAGVSYGLLPCTKSKLRDFNLKLRDFFYGPMEYTFTKGDDVENSIGRQ